MATNAAALREEGFGATQRRDAWWAGPLVTALVLGSFVVYTTFRIFQNAYFHFGDGTEILPAHSYVLSPMYSPLLVLPAWVPNWVSPAMLILWMPGGFRLTCYYYRKAYYRAFFLDPVACAVGEPRHSYKGETKFPFIIQNVHRYFMYAAVVFIFILSYDVWVATRWPVNGVLADGRMAAGPTTFGVGI